jgi:hypothetical protein
MDNSKTCYYCENEIAKDDHQWTESRGAVGEVLFWCSNCNKYLDLLQLQYEREHQNSILN